MTKRTKILTQALKKSKQSCDNNAFHRKIQLNSIRRDNKNLFGETLARCASKM